MPLVPSQKVVMEALDSTEIKRGWWAAEIGAHPTALSHYAHGTRPMPEELRLAAMASLARERPDIAANVWRTFLAPMGLTVDIASRPAPGSSRTAVARFGREAADVALVAAEVDEDGRRDAEELRRLLAEQREANAKGEEAEAALARDLIAAEEAEAQGRIPYGRRGELVNK